MPDMKLARGESIDGIQVPFPQKHGALRMVERLTRIPDPVSCFPRMCLS